MRKHLTYANVMATLAVFIALGGVAYAANTIGSSDIIDGQVKTADLAANAVNTSKISDGQVTEADIGQAAVATAELKNDAVTTAKVLNGTLAGGDVADNALKGADIDESTLAIGPSSGDFVRGRGTLLSNRLVLPDNAPETTLLEIPGLGVLTAFCGPENAGRIEWKNTTLSTIDRWHELNGSWTAELMPPGGAGFFADSNQHPGTTLALGLGNDPGARRIATLHLFALRTGLGAPCGFQVQGTLWTSG
jgi:hypothetical protein